MLQSRNQFALVLVDGDGYIFKDAFLQDAAKSGGADAASHLNNEIQNYLRANNLIPNVGEIEVMVNVYANKVGLARTLHDAGMIDHPNAFETFFQSFTRGKSLFHFIDCGPGKERADAKLRGVLFLFAPSPLFDILRPSPYLLHYHIFALTCFFSCFVPSTAWIILRST